MRPARVVHEADRFNRVEHPQTHRAGIHAHRAADAARNAFQEFQARQTVPLRFDGHRFQFRARAAMQPVICDVHAAEIRMRQGNDHAANTAIVDEQVRAAAQNHESDLVLHADNQDRGEFGLRRRLDVTIGRAADAQRGFFCKRFVLSEHRRGRERGGERREKQFLV